MKALATASYSVLTAGMTTGILVNLCTHLTKSRGLIKSTLSCARCESRYENAFICESAKH